MIRTWVFTVYEYNTLGLLIKQINPKGETISNEYDLQNRPVKRTEVEGVTEWIYDPIHAIGEVYQVKVKGILVQQNAFDSAGRPSQTNYIRNGSTKTFSYTYNTANGKLDTLKMPNNVTVKYGYTSNGYLSKITGIKIKAADVVLWAAGNYDHNNEAYRFSTRKWGYDNENV